MGPAGRLQPRSRRRLCKPPAVPRLWRVELHAARLVFNEDTRLGDPRIEELCRVLQLNRHLIHNPRFYVLFMSSMPSTSPRSEFQNCWSSPFSLPRRKVQHSTNFRAALRISFQDFIALSPRFKVRVVGGGVEIIKQSYSTFPMPAP